MICCCRFIRALKARSAFNVNLNGNYFKDTALEKIQSLLDGKEVGGMYIELIESISFFDSSILRI